MGLEGGYAGRDADAARSPRVAAIRTHVGSLTHFGRLAATVGLGAMMVAGVWMAIWVMVRGYSPVPFGDSWGDFPLLERALAGHVHIGDFWAQANEHRLVVQRGQIAIDYALFGGKYVSVFAAIALSALLIAALAAAAVWLETKDWFLCWSGFCVAAIATLSPAALENLTWAIPALVEVFLFAGVATLAVVLAARNGRHELRWAAVAALAAVAASYSIANGLLVWVTLIAIALVSSLRRSTTLMLVGAGAATTLSYLWHFEPVHRHADYWNSLTHPLALLKYVAVYLGAPVAASSSLRIAGFVGAVGLALCLLLGVVTWSERGRRSPATLWGAGMAFFVLLTAAETAVGRLNLGLEQALSTRYETGVAVFWVALLVGFLRSILDRLRISVRIGGRERLLGAAAWFGTAAVIALAVDLAALPSGASLRQRTFDRELTVVAFRSGVEDPAAVTGTPPGMPQVSSALRWLQHKSLGPWAPGGMVASSSFSLAPGSSAAPPCPGAVDTSDPIAGGTRFRGWIAPPGATRSSSQLAVLARGGRLRGLGIVGDYRPDVKAAGRSGSAWAGFVAYARGGAASSDVSDIVLVGDDHRHAICRLAAS